MKEFEFYIGSMLVKRVSADNNMAKALVEDAATRLEVASEMELTEKSSKIVFENAYEDIRELADALMALEGYKSYSHEASISFLLKIKNLSSSEVEKIDRLRKKRNGMKYYGRKSNPEEAENALKFATNVFKKLESQLKLFK